MESLIAIQAELKAPKGNFNSFGKYKYRSCEDILEAVKPICAKHNALLTLSDKTVQAGDRYYIEATAKLQTKESVFEATAYAREEETKKGMDASQITGTASSYARKYALNGLFCIDDTKDADTDEYTAQKKVEENKIITEFQVDELAQLCDKAHKNIANMCKYYGVKELANLTQGQYEDAKSLLKK